MSLADRIDEELWGHVKPEFNPRRFRVVSHASRRSIPCSKCGCSKREHRMTHQRQHHWCRTCGKGKCSEYRHG